MSIQVVVEEIEKDATLIHGADIEFVSLVRHGANRMPFRVVKSEEGGEKGDMPMFVQSILLPSGSKLEDISGKEGNEWMLEARSDKSQTYDDYTKLVQAEAKFFDPASMQLVKVSGGVLALVGKVMEGIDPSGMLTVGETSKSILDTKVGDPTQEAASPMNFKDMMYEEIDSMMNVIFGSLKQVASDPKKRKNAIIHAIDAFKGFMIMGIDQVGEKAVKTEWNPLTADKKEEEVMEKEEIVGLITKAIEAKFQELEAKTEKVEAKAPGTEPEKKEDKVETPDLAAMISKAVSDAMAPISQKVDELSAKTEKIGGQLVTEPAKKEEVTEETTPVKERKEGVFSGLLTGKALTSKGARNAFLGIG